MPDVEKTYRLAAKTCVNINGIQTRYRVELKTTRLGRENWIPVMPYEEFTDLEYARKVLQMKRTAAHLGKTEWMPLFD
jgi:hypothetical protein